MSSPRGFVSLLRAHSEGSRRLAIALSLLWVSDRSLGTRISNGMCLCPESPPKPVPALAPDLQH